jgi:hypothetical protein
MLFLEGRMLGVSALGWEVQLPGPVVPLLDPYVSAWYVYLYCCGIYVVCNNGGLVEDGMYKDECKRISGVIERWRARTKGSRGGGGR